MAEVGKDNYNLLPIILKRQPYILLDIPSNDHIMQVEVKVLWLNSDNTLDFPVFDLS